MLRVHQVEILEIEERKNNHINELMKKHEKAFGEIKNYYNDITHNNLDLIRSLKEEVRVAAAGQRRRPCPVLSCSSSLPAGRTACFLDRWPR